MLKYLINFLTPFRVLSRGQTKLRQVDVMPAMIKAPVIRAPHHLSESKVQTIAGSNKCFDRSMEV